MTQAELLTAINSIKYDYLAVNEVYFDRLSIGDRVSTIKQKEYLIALDIHIQCLEYIYNAWDYLEDLEITDTDISSTIGAALKCIRTFKSSYYG